MAYDKRSGIAAGGRTLLQRAGLQERREGGQQVSRMVVDREQLPPVVASYDD
jgi:hypothetical protein